jgi:hypothetical protein
MPEGDSSLTQVVRRHFDVDLVANADADEILTHLAGNMRQDLVSVGEGHTKHCARKDLCYRARQFNWFFFSHANQF